MCQPGYADMGKVTKDFFNKGYYFGVFHLMAKNRPCMGLETKTTGDHNLEDKATTAEFESKNYFPAYGISYTGKWNTKNLMTNQIEIKDKLVQGLKLAMENQFQLDTGVKLWKFPIQYKICSATFDLGAEGGDEANMALNGSAVGGYNNFLAGYQFAYDTTDGVLKKNNIALGYLGRGWTVHTSMDNVETITAAVHYPYNANLELGVQASYTSGSEDSNGTGTVLAVGMKYLLSRCSSVRMKVNKDYQVAVGYEIKVTDATTLTVCTEIQGAELNAGGHRVGLSLEFGN